MGKSQGQMIQKFAIEAVITDMIVGIWLAVCRPVIQARCLLGHASLDESWFLGSLLINFSSTPHARSLHPTRGVDFVNAAFPGLGHGVAWEA